MNEENNRNYRARQVFNYYTIKERLNKIISDSKEAREQLSPEENVEDKFILTNHYSASRERENQQIVPILNELKDEYDHLAERRNEILKEIPKQGTENLILYENARRIFEQNKSSTIGETTIEQILEEPTVEQTSEEQTNEEEPTVEQTPEEQTNEEKPTVEQTPEEPINTEIREIEKIRNKIFENYNISTNLTNEFIKENEVLVKEKLATTITNSNLVEETKTSLLNRLNNANNSNSIISVMQDRNLNLLKDNQFMINIIEEELSNIETNTQTIQNTTEETEENLDEKIKQQKEKIDEYQKEMEAKGLNYTEQYMDQKYIELVNELTRLETLLNQQKPSKDSKNINSKNEQSEKRKEYLTKYLGNFKNRDNKDLLEIKDIYYTIKNNVVNNLKNNEKFFELSEEEQKNMIKTKFIEQNQELIAILNQKYENSGKLCQELLEEIYQKLKSIEKKQGHPQPEPVPEVPEEIEEEKPKKDWKKWAAGIVGFATGVGLSFVPVGSVGMIVAVSRLAYSAGKSAVKYAEQNPENKISKIINVTSNKLESKISKITSITKEKLEKYPKIQSFIDKTKEILKKPETQWALNGIALGYTAGKIGQFVHSQLTPQPKPDPTPNRATPDPDPVPDVPVVETNTVPGIGDKVDISGVKGFVNSLGEGKTSIIKELAENAEIIGEKNGYYLLNGSDGELLGWFKISDIEEKAKIVKDVAETVAKNTR